MIRSLIALCSLAALSLTAQTAPQQPQLQLKARTDRADALYKVGETATFLLTVTQDGQPLPSGHVTCVLSKDGHQPQPPQVIEVKDGEARLTGTLQEPGFLLLRAVNGSSSALASAAYEPLKIAPSLPVPEDFDAFWANQKKALAAVPMKATLTPAPSSAEGIEVFDVQVTALGAPVSGYLARPKNAQPRSLPAILFVHGAGVVSANSGRPIQWAGREGGMLAMDINAHGLPNGHPKSYYDELYKGRLNNYRYVGRTDREQNYFKGMFLRLVRAIDFLTSQPTWDGRTVIVYGSSQGGFQAFAASALDPRVSYFCAGVPAGGDHSGAVVNRISGWPKLVPNGPDGKPDPLALETSRYFDNVNFARRAHGKGAAVTVGYIDLTCPPTSVYAAYNALVLPKKLHVDVLAGHTNTLEASRFMEEAALAHIRAQKQR